MPIQIKDVDVIHRIARHANAAATAYYEIKNLKKKIKEQKVILARHAKKLQVYNIDGKKLISGPNESEMEIKGYDVSSIGHLVIKGSDFEKTTCSRFIKHLEAGDLVKTVETKDNG